MKVVNRQVEQHGIRWAILLQDGNDSFWCIRWEPRGSENPIYNRLQDKGMLRVMTGSEWEFFRDYSYIIGGDYQDQPLCLYPPTEEQVKMAWDDPVHFLTVECLL